MCSTLQGFQPNTALITIPKGKVLRSVESNACALICCENHAFSLLCTHTHTLHTHTPHTHTNTLHTHSQTHSTHTHTHTMQRRREQKKAAVVPQQQKSFLDLGNDLEEEEGVEETDFGPTPSYIPANLPTTTVSGLYHSALVFFQHDYPPYFTKPIPFYLELKIHSTNLSVN